MPRPTTCLGGTGFDRGGITAVNRYFQSITTNASLPAIQTGTGRRGGNSLRMNYSCRLAQIFPAASGFWLLFAMKPNTIPSSNTTLLRLTRGGVNQVAVGIASDGRLTAGTGGATTGLGITTNGFSTGFYSQVVLYFTSHNTTGVVKAFWNGSLTADTGMDGTAGNGLGDTLNGGDGFLDGFAFGNGGDALTFDIDDLYYGSGADLGTSGDLAVVHDVPQSDGTHNDGVCTTGTNRTAMVNDVTPDVDDSSTIALETGKQTFHYADLPYTPASIAAVIQKWMVKKNEAGTRTLADLIDNGTEYSGTPVDLTTDYRIVDLIRQDIAAAALTKANVDAAEWGGQFA